MPLDGADVKGTLAPAEEIGGSELCVGGAICIGPVSGTGAGAGGEDVGKAGTGPCALLLGLDPLRAGDPSTSLRVEDVAALLVGVVVQGVVVVRAGGGVESDFPSPSLPSSPSSLSCCSCKGFESAKD